MTQDRKVIACNSNAEFDGIVPEGAKCYLSLLNPGGGHDRVQILARSTSGRYIVRWQDTRDLTDFRAKTLPPEHPLHGDNRLWDLLGEHEIEALTEASER